MDRMYDLSFEQQDDGTIRLMQNDCGEDYIIGVHPEQLKFIVRRLAGMDDSTAARVEDLERKIAVLADRLESLVDAEWFRNSIIKHCGNGVEILNKLDGLLDLAIEFDGGRLLPSDADKEEAEPPPPPPPKANRFPQTPPPPHLRNQPDLLT